MKKLSLSQKTRQIRLSLWGMLRRKKRKKRERKHENKTVEHGVIRVYAPEIFSVSPAQYRKLLMGFLSNLRTCYKRHSDNNILLIDFSSTKWFVADGTALFYAELNRLIAYGYKKHGSNMFKLQCVPPKDERASQVLEQIGVYKLCSYQFSGKTTFDDVVHWRVAQGHQVDNNICGPEIIKYEGQLATPLVDGIIRGLGEATTNTVQHAYLDTREDDLDFNDIQDWWMFSQSKDGYLSVILCDLGIGIPRSLPIEQPGLFKRLLTLGYATSDAACIEEALKESRSRVRTQGRGHGLTDIIDAVSASHDGHVAIFSNKGYYTLYDGKATKFNFGVSILGTLICWRIPLNGEASDGV